MEVLRRYHMVEKIKDMRTYVCLRNNSNLKLVEMKVINHLLVVLSCGRKSLVMKTLFEVIPNNSEKMMEKLSQ